MAPSADTFMARVTAATTPAPGLRVIELAAAEGGQLPGFPPGAHVSVRIPPRGPERPQEMWRSYSLVAFPDELPPIEGTPRTLYRLGVLREAAGKGGSRYMHDELRVGDFLTLRLPPNGFPLQAPRDGIHLVAGGIGITPLVTMASALSNAGVDCVLHYTCRQAAHHLFTDRLGALAGCNVRLYADEDPAGAFSVAGFLDGLAPATQNSPIVERMQKAGAIPVGKTTMPELGWKGLTDSPRFGVTRNPWDLSRNAGGSSGGSQSGGGTNVGLAGAVTVAVLKGKTEAVLGDNVDVNADKAANDAAAHAQQGIVVRGTDQTNVGQDTGGGTFALNGDVGITGSVAVVDSEQKVWGTALGHNTLRSLGGGVTLEAKGKTDIDTLVIAVAGVVSTGSSQNTNNSSSINFAGAGAVTVNIVENESIADVGAASLIDTTGALRMNAEDNSAIVSDAGGVAFALSTGQSQGGTTAGSIGASVAVNDITQLISARSTDTPITAASVDIDATNNASIDTLTIAGSGSFSNSSTAFGGAGSGSGNYIDATTRAGILNPSGVLAVTATGGAVSINALDNSKVNADAGARFNRPVPACE